LAGDEAIISGYIVNDFERIILLADPDLLCLRGASFESKRATWTFKLFDILLSASFLI
jgi:hypothetical protein